MALQFRRLLQEDRPFYQPSAGIEAEAGVGAGAVDNRWRAGYGDSEAV